MPGKIIHGTILQASTTTLCGKPITDEVQLTAERGSMGWRHVRCAHCREEVANQQAMNRAELIASRRFNF